MEVALRRFRAALVVVALSSACLKTTTTCAPICFLTKAVRSIYPVHFKTNSFRATMTELPATRTLVTSNGNLRVAGAEERIRIRQVSSLSTIGLAISTPPSASSQATHVTGEHRGARATTSGHRFSEAPLRPNVASVMAAPPTPSTSPGGAMSWVSTECADRGGCSQQAFVLLPSESQGQSRG